MCWWEGGREGGREGLTDGRTEKGRKREGEGWRGIERERGGEGEGGT